MVDLETVCFCVSVSRIKYNYHEQKMNINEEAQGTITIYVPV